MYNNIHQYFPYNNQEILNISEYKGNVDGYYYTLSEEAVKKFQSTYTKHPDGIMDAGQTTWKKLLGIK